MVAVHGRHMLANLTPRVGVVMPGASRHFRLRASRDAALAAAMAAEERVHARSTRRSRRPNVKVAGKTSRDCVANACATRRRAVASRADFTRFAGRHSPRWRVAGPVARAVVNELQRPMSVRAAAGAHRDVVRAIPTGPTLRVRFYPDDISLAAPLAPSRTMKRKLGRAYWRSGPHHVMRPADESAARV